MAKKGPVGPRVTIEWGTVKKKVKGKSVSVRLSSQVLKSTADLFGLKESKGTTVGATTKSVAVKKGGKRLILVGGVSRVATRKMFASTDGKVFHQLPVPSGLSLAKAFAVFKAGKKAYEVKFQGGTSRVIGKPTKDTKTKSKAADKTAK